MTRKKVDPETLGKGVAAGTGVPSFTPSGWALSHGPLLPIHQNQALFSLLGTGYGGGSAVSTPTDPWSLGFGLVPGGAAEKGRTYDPYVAYAAGYDAPVATRVVDTSHKAGTLFLAEGRSELAFLGRFAERVVLASVYLASALARGNLQDFRPTRQRPVFKPRGQVEGWHVGVANAVFMLFGELRQVLVHPWIPSAATYPLVHHAFTLLAEITPAYSTLNRLYALDSERAFRELGLQLDIVAEQVRLGVSLATDLETAMMSDEAAVNEERLVEIQNAILAETGETLKLSAAADRLGTSRQNLHQRIRRGSAIGVLKNGEIIVPTSQFVKVKDKEKIVDGLSMIVGPFLESGAGHWSALQFLVDVEPNLGVSPLDALKAGAEPTMIAHLADAYVGHPEQEDQAADEQ